MPPEPRQPTCKGYPVLYGDLLPGTWDLLRGWGRLSCRTPHPLPLQRPPPALVSEDVHKIVEAQRGVARRRLAPLRQPAALPQEDVGLDRGLDDEPDAFGRPLLPDAADAADGLLLDAGLQARLE